MTTAAGPTSNAPRPARAPRKREQTRARMVRAAGEVFAAQGTTNVSIEAVCERAGYTRGAFYSNFASMDELLVAVYEQRAQASQDRLEQAVEAVLHRFAGRIGVEDAVHGVLEVLPLDVEWFRLRTVFIAQATQRPEGRQLLRRHQDAQRARLQELLISALRAAGRVPTVEDAALARAVLAAHDGAIARTLADDEDAARALRVDAVQGVLLGLTEPASRDAGLTG